MVLRLPKAPVAGFEVRDMTALAATYRHMAKHLVRRLVYYEIVLIALIPVGIELADRLQ